MRAVGHVQVGFIQRQRLYQVRIAREDFTNMVRGLFVGIETARQQGQVRTELKGHGGRHRAAHAILAGGVIGGADHAALHPAAADSDGNITQGGVVAHFNRCEKAVHIDVYDFAHRPLLLHWLSIQCYLLLKRRRWPG